MTFKIGDTVMTKSGRLYVVRSFWTSARQGESANLQPLLPGKRRRQTHAAVASLTLVRTAELSMAFSYAQDSQREGIEDWQREKRAALAAHWLTLAEQRNDDSRAALYLGSDRILELEAAA